MALWRLLVRIQAPETCPRTQFAVLLARIDPICPSDLGCHLLRSLSTAVLGVEMNVGARLTLDTEFFCQAMLYSHKSAAEYK